MIQTICRSYGRLADRNRAIAQLKRKGYNRFVLFYDAKGFFALSYTRRCFLMLFAIGTRFFPISAGCWIISWLGWYVSFRKAEYEKTNETREER